jgi:hypothetical protein
MLKHTFLLVLLSCLFGACSTKLKPMYIPCKVPKQTFINTATDFLKANNYKIVETNANEAFIEATRTPIQTSLGENLEINGPYLFQAMYKGDSIKVNVATYFRESGRNKTFQTHDDSRRTDEADKQFFMPVVYGLRNMCRN